MCSSLYLDAVGKRPIIDRQHIEHSVGSAEAHIALDPRAQALVSRMAEIGIIMSYQDAVEFLHAGSLQQAESSLGKTRAGKIVQSQVLKSHLAAREIIGGLHPSRNQQSIPISMNQLIRSATDAVPVFAPDAPSTQDAPSRYLSAFGSPQILPNVEPMPLPVRPVAIKERKSAPKQQSLVATPVRPSIFLARIPGLHQDLTREFASFLTKARESGALSSQTIAQFCDWFMDLHGVDNDPQKDFFGKLLRESCEAANISVPDSYTRIVKSHSFIPERTRPVPSVLEQMTRRTAERIFVDASIIVPDRYDRQMMRQKVTWQPTRSRIEDRNTATREVELSDPVSSKKPRKKALSGDMLRARKDAKREIQVVEEESLTFGTPPMSQQVAEVEVVIVDAAPASQPVPLSESLSAVQVPSSPSFGRDPTPQQLQDLEDELLGKGKYKKSRRERVHEIADISPQTSLQVTRQLTQEELEERNILDMFGAPLGDFEGFIKALEQSIPHTHERVFGEEDEEETEGSEEVRVATEEDELSADEEAAVALGYDDVDDPVVVKDNIDFAALGIDPSKSSTERPGTEEKLLMLIARYAEGYALWNEHDSIDHSGKGITMFLSKVGGGHYQ